MKDYIKYINVIFVTVGFAFLFSACQTLMTPKVETYQPLNKYKYFYINPVAPKVSGTMNRFGGVESSTDPTAIIANALMLEGFIRLPFIVDDKKTETMVVNYGEGEQIIRGLGYSIMVRIQFVSAENYELICQAEADGMGENEAEDIRMAINRALTSIFPK